MLVLILHKPDTKVLFRFSLLSLFLPHSKALYEGACPDCPTALHEGACLDHDIIQKPYTKVLVLIVQQPYTKVLVLIISESHTKVFLVRVGGMAPIDITDLALVVEGD